MILALRIVSDGDDDDEPIRLWSQDLMVLPLTSSRIACRATLMIIQMVSGW